MITGTAYRITTLTDRMIRLEYNKDGKFIDECTQLVANRDFPECPCKILREKDGLRIDTGKLVICYDEKPFASGGLSIEVKSTGAVWHYGKTYASNDKNFRGTGRTLDGADGGIWLEKGLFGELGYGVLDDSTSPILLNGEFQKRENGGLDLYFFGYGKDYREGLKDFMRLAGSVPLLPRYALGNWWSRYHRYTEEEYTDLLEDPSFRGGDRYGLAPDGSGSEIRQRLDRLHLGSRVFPASGAVLEKTEGSGVCGNAESSPRGRDKAF